MSRRYGDSDCDEASTPEGGDGSTLISWMSISWKSPSTGHSHVRDGEHGHLVYPLHVADRVITAAASAGGAGVPSLSDSGGWPATARPMLLGITKASLSIARSSTPSIRTACCAEARSAEARTDARTSARRRRRVDLRITPKHVEPVLPDRPSFVVRPVCRGRNHSLEEIVSLNPLGSVTSNARLPHSVSCGSESRATPAFLARAAS